MTVEVHIKYRFDFGKKEALQALPYLLCPKRKVFNVVAHSAFEFFRPYLDGVQG